ncbi:54S ribosomal protein L28, mitochondrial [Hypsizygus marmoreus]|uniref:Large ribosomal subunit protein mL40 n=1 Tax=Hypsizygus marmoreus TaxID=39966 RepID=A0A369K2A9_HYPMA|nr:54S ribosomal protein L28, mitochondrial [Hypsizygus marmoreus]
MSTALLAPSRTKLALRVVQTPIRGYAAKNEPAGDPKKEIIRKALYPGNIRNRASPTGTWRPDVGRALQYAIPSVQAHHTIERAWLLHKRHVRKQREAELARKFECMRRAMEELERVDSRLYMEANKQEDPRARTDAERELAKTLKTTEVRTLEARIRGLFPRELRIPTDTPPRSGWNYEWKPFPRPL